MNIERKWIVKLYWSRRQPRKSDRRINFTIKLNRLTYNRFNFTLLRLPIFWYFSDFFWTVSYQFHTVRTNTKCWKHEVSPMIGVLSISGSPRSLESTNPWKNGDQSKRKNFLVRIFLFGSISAFKICTGFDPFFFSFLVLVEVSTGFPITFWSGTDWFCREQWSTDQNGFVAWRLLVAWGDQTELRPE